MTIRLDTSRGLLLIFASGLAIREVFAPFTGHPFDFELWLRLGYYTFLGHDPYTYTSPIPGLSFPGAGTMSWLGYPPPWAFFQAWLYAIYHFSGVDNRFLYYFIVKQPMVISDLLCGFLLYRIVSIYSDKRSGVRALTFWIFCPFTIIISSIWGMFDQLILVIVLASVLLLNETTKSALLESLGFLLKVIPLIFLPLLAFLQRSNKKIAQYLLISLASSAFFSLAPYLVFKTWNLNMMLGVGSNVAGKISTSMNFWNLVDEAIQSPNIPSEVSLASKALAYSWVPAVILASYFCLKAIRKVQPTLRERYIYFSLLFITLVFLLTKAQVNEQYLIYFLGFGLVDYFVIGSRVRKKLFNAIWITALAFLVVNNTLLTRMFEPISTYFNSLDYYFTNGFPGAVRLFSLDVLCVLFTTLCLLYLKSLYSEMKTAMLKGSLKPQLVSV